jgi:hypothetical protein
MRLSRFTIKDCAVIRKLTLTRERKHVLRKHTDPSALDNVVIARITRQGHEDKKNSGRLLNCLSSKININTFTLFSSKKKVSYLVLHHTLCFSLCLPLLHFLQVPVDTADFLNVKKEQIVERVKR